jgi:prepilin-type processing-associated H-X9-DG protein
MKCQNSLRQIGLALHAYHDRVGRLPAGYLSNLSGPASQDANGNCAWDETGPGWGWAAYLLSDLEQDNLQQQIRFDLNISDPQNAAARTTTVAIYLCPSDPQRGPFTVVDANDNPLTDVARSSYVAMNGVLGVTGDAFDNNGVFLRNRRFRLADITDGLSNTLFVGERASNMSTASWTGAVTGGVVPAQRYSDPVQQLAKAEGAAALVLAHGSRTHIPNDQLVFDADATSSYHFGMVNFLFGDGSVRAISNDINGSTYEALLTRAGGEVISGSDF